MPMTASPMLWKSSVLLNLGVPQAEAGVPDPDMEPQTPKIAYLMPNMKIRAWNLIGGVQDAKVDAKSGVLDIKQTNFVDLMQLLTIINTTSLGFERHSFSVILEQK
ncbi:hypothetical protein L1987_72492 [Smallanthus sonchifolius]|uniref:Uncharacterized protein n=1 Tax=Smallanthus sonchifolius TaxID=185202 RepID=A0ACB9AZS1_9ASTR|nr:hypothetical protein L1987_72492 [Smallanthus sonchifolius]